MLRGLSDISDERREEALGSGSGFTLEDVVEEGGYNNFILTDSLNDALA